MDKFKNTNIVNRLTGSGLFRAYRSSKDKIYDYLLDDCPQGLVQAFQKRLGNHNYCIGSHPRYWVWERNTYNLFVSNGDEGFTMEVDDSLSPEACYALWWVVASTYLHADEIEELLREISNEPT